MRQAVHRIAIATRGRGLYEITAEVTRWMSSEGMATGLLTIFIRHTSASLLVQENADPDVRTDVETFFEKLAPEGKGLYVHSSEGPDDMPAHLRSALTQTHLSIPVIEGRLALGTWQGIYVFEHRRAPHRRDVALHLLGE